MLIELLLLLLTLFGLLYWYVTKSFDRWEKLGVPHEKPSFPFGTAKDLLMMKKHGNDTALEEYAKYGKEKFYGGYIFGKPTLAINDPDLLRIILVKDFESFTDRNGSIFSEKLFRTDDDLIWSKQMTNLDGQEWKNVRSAFSPIFTSGKMKIMIKLILEAGKSFEKELDKIVGKKEEFELKELYGKFTMDSLASAVFGLNAESFTNPDSKFIKYSTMIMKSTFTEFLKLSIAFIPGMAEVFGKLNISLMKPEAIRFFIDVIKTIIKQRRASKVRRNDMIDLMLDIMKGNQVDNDEDDHACDQFETDSKINHAKSIKDISDDHLIATAMAFLAAGYETTSVLLGWAGYELAVNPDVQERLQQEVDEAFEENGGNFPDYTTVQNLPYLDQVVHETLRLHSPFGVNNRICKQPFTIPGTDIVLIKGDMVTINIIGIHSDKRYYKNADKFDPEHFTKEAKAQRHPYTFQAFGQGPRNCVGMRFALLEAKVALATTSRRFALKPSPKTVLDKTLEAGSHSAYPKLGLWVTAERRGL